MAGPYRHSKEEADMSVLTRPRPKLIEDAIRLGSLWCAGQRIDGGPAFGHGVRVARTVDRHFPDAPLTWAATALVHDAPDFVAKGEMDQVIGERLGEEVLAYVWGLWAEHEVYEVCDQHPEIADARVPELARVDLPLLRLMAADQFIAFTDMQRRIKRAVLNGQSEPEFWVTRGALLARMEYFLRFHDAARPHVPAAMHQEWGQCLALIPQESG